MSAAPCSRCIRPAELFIGTSPLCGECWSTWRAELVARHGISRVSLVGEVVIVERDGGPVRSVHRPDHGPDQYELACPICEATWVGNPADTCPWCARREARLLAEQRALVLTPPDPATIDALNHWAARLRRAVDAGIVEEDVARSCLVREVKRAS